MSSEWDAEQLLGPISVDAPCGENLEDTQLLASFDAFRLFGQSISPDPAPEWGEIKGQALEALGKSKDLRLLAHLGAAVVRTDGVPAFLQVVQVASQWLDSYWDHVFPLIDEDALLRRNALNCFADQIAVVDGLRRSPLVSSRQHGKFSLRDIEIATGLTQPSEVEAKPDDGQINAAFAAMPVMELRSLQQGVADALLAVKSIETRMREVAGAEEAPSFDPLSTQLTKMDRVLRTHLALHPDNDSAGISQNDGGYTGVKPPAVSTPGTIKSRQDAVRALDAVADFFRQTEPSSPIPLFLERAKRLVSKSFLEVLADIAPDALTQARAAGGVREGE